MRRAIHALAAAAYLAVALFTLRHAWTDPTRLLPYPADQDTNLPQRAVSYADQMKEANATLRAAYALLHAPRQLFDGDCYPIPRGVTFGENLFAEGVLATVPYALTGQPILTFNVVVALALALAGIGMYALAWHWTRDAGAAFVAGLLFEIVPVRLSDPHHPFCHADHWVPLFLLFFHRIVLHGRWRDAVALAAVGSLQMMESAYNILEFGLLVGTFGLVEVIRHRRTLAVWLPKLVAAGAIVAAVAVVVLRPFAETRALWPPSGHYSWPIPTSQLLPGGLIYPGTMAVVLAVIALADRLLRRGAHGDDPRIAMLAAGFVCAWAGTGGLPMPVGVPTTSALFRWIWPLVQPALSGLRGLFLVVQGAGVAVTFLAAFGVTAFPRRLRVAVAGGAVLAALLEVFHPGLAHRSFGRSVAMRTRNIAPSAAEVGLLQRMGDGAVLDVPFLAGDLRFEFEFVPHYAAFRMYHHHRMAACPTSLGGPAEPEVSALAVRLPDPKAADALAAMGFRNVVVHEEYLGAAELARWRRMPDASRLTVVGRAGTHVLFALASPTPVLASFDALEPSVLPIEELRPTGLVVSIPLTLRNRSTSTYRHPDPIQPTTLAVRWQGLAGQQAATSETRVLLPIALAAGEELRRTLALPVPGFGPWEVTIALPEGRPLARAYVTLALPPEGKALPQQ